jgi:hypothetical protein
MMLFRTVKQALETTLMSNANGQFTVEGYQRQSHAAEEILGTLRHVSVFYSRGAFDKARSGWLSGPWKHAMTFTVQLELSAQASMDLSVLNPNVTATGAQRMAALAASQTAGIVADEYWDQLAEIVWQILINPVNQQLGLTPPIGISDRWIDNISKEHPAPVGEYVILTGTMDYSCLGSETTAGVIGTPAGKNAIDVTLNETADITGAVYDPAQQGAKSSP